MQIMAEDSSLAVLRLTIDEVLLVEKMAEHFNMTRRQILTRIMERGLSAMQMDYIDSTDRQEQEKRNG